MKKLNQIVKKYLVPIGILLFIASFLLWRYQSSRPSYRAVEVREDNLSEYLELAGTVEAAEQASLFFPTGGLVTYLGANEGDQVSKWQTLAALDKRQLQNQLTQKLNLFMIERQNFDQSRDYNDNSVPGGDAGRELERLLAKNQYKLENTIKDVEYQSLALRLSSIYSPISGVLVASPSITPGSYVAATDKWLVVNPTSLYFEAELDEADLALVRLDQNTEITLDAFPELTFPSKVSNISFAPVETSTGTIYKLKFFLDQAQLRDLRLGLNGSARILLRQVENVRVIPQSAVIQEGGKLYVFIKEGDKYERVEVELGLEQDGLVQLKNLPDATFIYTESET